MGEGWDWHGEENQDALWGHIKFEMRVSHEGEVRPGTQNWNLRGRPGTENMGREQHIEWCRPKFRFNITCCLDIWGEPRGF